MIFALMEKKTELAYKALLDYVQERSPLQPEHIMADFEVALGNAFRKKYPHAKVHGCFFHYTQVRT